MSWSADESRQVGRAILGSWPGTVTAWGKDAFAAYVSELEARGLEADRVLVAVRTWPAGSDFPPSAPNLAAQARRDPSVPTFDEAWQLIQHCLAARTEVRKARWEIGERDRLNDQAALDRAHAAHPLVAEFMVRQGGPAQLRALRLDDPGNEFREPRRRELAARWAEHVEAFDGREVAALASGRREQLARFDPLAVLGDRRPELGEGS